MRKLAIVIPAYKLIYFEQVLQSIAAQTCKNFILYVGIDGSLEDFQPLIKKYSSKIDTIYKLFEENLGSSNLVAHWQRCIDLTQNEEWIWLFSDDDKMDPTCVDEFFKALATSDADLFHFNVEKIDESNLLVEKCPEFPQLINVEDFVEARLTRRIQSFVIEYIFRRSHFEYLGGFQHFDLAWGSDDATWIKIGKQNGIVTLDMSIVQWRQSPFNISPNLRNKKILERKLSSQIQYAAWLIRQQENRLIEFRKDKLSLLLKAWFLDSIKEAVPYLSSKIILRIFASFSQLISEPKNIIYKITFIYTFKMYLGLKGFVQNFLKKKRKKSFQSMEMKLAFLLKRNRN